MSYIGNSTIEATVGGLDNNIIMVERFQFPAACTVIGLELYCSATGGAGYGKPVLYSDKAGPIPNARLATGPELSVPDGSGDAWRPLLFATPYSIGTPGYFWFGLLCRYSYLKARYTNASGAYTLKLADYAGGGPNPYGAAGVFTRRYSIRAIIMDSPAAPTVGTAARVSDTQATIGWTNHPTTVAPYTSLRILRYTDGGGVGTQVATGLAGTTTGYTDTTVTANHAYTYVVRAVNVAGWGTSAVSNAIYTTPAAPTTVVATKTGPTVVTVGWTDPSNSEQYFEVSRTSDGGATWPILSSTVAAGVTTYVDSAVPAGTVAYRLRALRGALASAYSAASNNVATITPPAAPTLTPAWGTYSPTGSTLRVAWQHNTLDGSAQSAADVVYTIDGVETTYTVTGATAYYDIDISAALAAEIVTAKVRTYGLHASPSVYSAIGSTTLAAPPVAVITTPAVDDAVVTDTPLVVAWDYTDAFAQAGWTLQIYRSGVLVRAWTGTTETSQSIAITDLVDDSSFSLVLTVRSGSGFTAIATRLFETDYVPPMAPLVEATFEPGSLAVTVSGAISPPNFPNRVTAGVAEAVLPTTDSGWADYVDGARGFFPAATNYYLNPGLVGVLPFAHLVLLAGSGTNVWELVPNGDGTNTAKLTYTVGAGDEAAGCNVGFALQDIVLPAGSAASSLQVRLTRSNARSFTEFTSVVFRVPDYGEAGGPPSVTTLDEWVDCDAVITLTGDPAAYSRVWFLRMYIPDTCVAGDVLTLEIRYPKLSGESVLTPYFDGSTQPPATAWNVSGGTITYDGAYTVHKFTSSGTLVVGGTVEAEALVIGGGGGGATGGGGAGGYLTGTETLTGSMAVTVGAGGPGIYTTAPTAGEPGTDGGDSVFGTRTAKGGGGGGGLSGAGRSGGSGGGGGNEGTPGGAATPAGQGYAGGAPSGGGGGAGGVGGNGVDNVTGGTGGPGLSNDISGVSVGRAGGGGGGTWVGESGAGTATHGGGAGTAYLQGAAADGVANTGGGGGGAGYGATGGTGGTGVVIVRYLTAATAGGIPNASASTRAASNLNFTDYVHITSAGVVPAGAKFAYYRESAGPYYGPVIVADTERDAGQIAAIEALWDDLETLWAGHLLPGDMLLPLDSDGNAYVKVFDDPPATDHLALVRVETFDGIEETAVLADPLIEGGAFIDPSPRLDLDVTYRVLAVAANGAYSITDAIVATKSRGAAVLNFGDGFTEILALRWDGQRGHDSADDSEAYTFAGRDLPVVYTGEHTSETLSAAATVFDDASRTAMRALRRWRKACYYREPYGYRARVKPGKIADTPGGTPQSTDISIDMLVVE